MKLERNMAGWDRIARLIIAIVLGAAVVAGALVWPWDLIAGLVAVVFVLTSAVGFCPLYALLGIRTAAPTRS
jgi:hypothetical protein